MGNTLNVSKSDTWIMQGAPAQALEFLGEAVNGLSQKAMKENIVFKEKSMAKKTVTKEKEIEEEVSVIVPDEEEETPAAITEEDVTEDATPSTPSVNDSDTGPTTDTPATTPTTTPGASEASIMKAFQDGVAEAIVSALKQYHTDIVVPMQAQMAELTAPSQPKMNKQYSMVENVFLNASDFMPAAAVSAMLKKEFGTEAVQAGDKTATAEEIEESTTIVKEKKVTKSQGDDGNLLSGF